LLMMRGTGETYRLDSWEFPNTLYVVRVGRKNKESASLEDFGLEVFMS